MAATRAMWDFWEFYKTVGSSSEKTYFRSYGQMRLTTISRPTYNKKLKRFEKHGLLVRHKTPLGHVFHITAKARQLRHKPTTKILRDDSLSTLIIFDIPEEKHNARDILRRFLIRNGYTLIRESCFLSPFKISSDLKELIEELQLEKNISFFSAKSNFIF